MGIVVGDGVTLGVILGKAVADGKFIAVDGIIVTVSVGGMGDAEVGALVNVSEAHTAKVIRFTVINVNKSRDFMIYSVWQVSYPSE
ncbi:MAG: hypothetical protein PVF74_04820 [Anaerolineales bacterium]